MVVPTSDENILGCSRVIPVLATDLMVAPAQQRRLEGTEELTEMWGLLSDLGGVDDLHELTGRHGYHGVHHSQDWLGNKMLKI